MPSTTATDRIDLTDLDLFRFGFPDEVFAHLRATAPVWWHEPTEHTPDGVGFWVVSTHAETQAVAGDAEAFSSERAPGREGGGTLIQDLPFGFASGVLLNMMDDPRHAAIRRLLTPQVGPKAIAAMEPELRRRAVAIVEAVADRGACDFLTDVAVELPLQAVAALLGVPFEDRHDLMAWSNATLDFEGRELGETSDAVQRANAWMTAYSTRFVEERAAAGRDDPIGVLAAAVLPEIAGEPEVSHLELEMFFHLLIAAGSETTRNSIALGLDALLDHPDQLEALRADRSLLPRAVEEILRWTSATLYNRRTATRDVEVAGTTIREGDKVTLWWASANRDESVFVDPFRFDVTRDPNPHLTFGYRSHFCLGANLARMEIRIIFDELLDRLEAIERAGPIERMRTNKHAGVAHMPITYRARG